MNKEQSADDPSVDLIRVKNMLNSTISMSYPDVQPQLHMSQNAVSPPEHSNNVKAQRLVKHDNNMKDYS